MKQLVISLLIFCTFWGSSLAAEDEIILTIGEEVTWKSLFDAGFEPHHVRDGVTRCRQFNVIFGIRVHAAGEVLYMGKGDVWFDLLDNHVLVHMSFYGRENRTVEEAEQKTEMFVRMFGDHLTKKSVVRRYEATDRVDHSDAVNHAKLGDFSIFYNFGDSYERDEPMLERFSVSLKSKIAKRGKRLKTKIKPPEGYEHISLEPVLNPRLPEEVQEIAPHGEPQNNGPNDAKVQEKSASESESKSASLPWWVWMIAAGAALGSIVILVCFRAREDG